MREPIRLDLCDCKEPQTCTIPKPPTVCRRLAGIPTGIAFTSEDGPEAAFFAALSEPLTVISAPNERSVEGTAGYSVQSHPNDN